MATPPTLTAYTSVIGGSTTPQTVSVTVAVGDVLWVGAAAEIATMNIAAPTGGSGFTWTAAGVEDGGTSNTAVASAWTTTATSAQTFTLSVSASGTTAYWSFVCIKASGSDGVGNFANGNNGTGSGAPSVNLTTTQANSAIAMVCVDYQALTTTPTYRTINGSVGTEQAKIQNAVHYSAYFNTWADAGAVGTYAVGMTAPSTQRWVLCCVELKGTTSSGAYNGTSSVSESTAITTTGGTSATSSVSETTTITTSGGGTGTSSVSESVSTSATGGTSGTTAVSPAVAITTSGSVTSSGTGTVDMSPVTSVTTSGGTSGGSSVSSAVTLTTTGGGAATSPVSPATAITTTGGPTGATSVSPAASITTTGVAAAVATTSPTSTVAITTSGTVSTGSGISPTVSITTAGTTSATTAVSVAVVITTADGIASNITPTLSITTDGTVSATGQVSIPIGVSIDTTLTAPTFRFSPPTFEAAMLTAVRPLHYYRETYAASVVRVNGALTSLRTPSSDQLTAAGIAGTDYFIGGHIYEISQSTATELVAAGYTVEEIT